MELGVKGQRAFLGGVTSIHSEQFPLPGLLSLSGSARNCRTICLNDRWIGWRETGWFDKLCIMANGSEGQIAQKWIFLIVGSRRLVLLCTESGDVPVVSGTCQCFLPFIKGWGEEGLFAWTPGGFKKCAQVLSSLVPSPSRNTTDAQWAACTSAYRFVSKAEMVWNHSNATAWKSKNSASNVSGKSWVRVKHICSGQRGSTMDISEVDIIDRTWINFKI